MPEKQNSSSEPEIVFHCPITQQPLRPVTAEECDSFPGDFAEGGYLSENDQILYPVRNGFPLLVPSEAVHQDEQPNR